MDGAETCLSGRDDIAVIAEPYRRFELVALRLAKDAGILTTCSSRSTASNNAGAGPWIAVQARLLRISMDWSGPPSPAISLSASVQA